MALESSVTFDFTQSAMLFEQRSIKAGTMTVTADVVLCSKGSFNFVAEIILWLLFFFDFAEEVQAKVKLLILKVNYSNHPVTNSST